MNGDADDELRRLRDRIEALERLVSNRRPDVVLHALSRSPVYLMYVTTAVTKRTGVTAGSGAAKYATYGSVGTGMIDPGSDDPVPVQNMHTDKGFKVNCYVAAFEFSGGLWVFDVDACANLSS